LGDWFLLKTYFLTSKASPNDSAIVIIVIIIVIGEAKLVLHMVGIIAQTVYLSRAFSMLGERVVYCNHVEICCLQDRKYNHSDFMEA
jgi:hypothetical protein